MKPDFFNRVLNGLLGLITLIVGAQLATQVTALRLAFQAGLGQPLIASLHLYNPLKFFSWTMDYWQVPALKSYLLPGVIIFSITCVIVVIFTIFYNIQEYLQKGRATTHGSARFAQFSEIITSGTFYNTDALGVYIGGVKHKKKIWYLRDSSATHVFAYAPSRSGKGVGLIVPTLLTYQGSAIISDFKLENWQLTAGARAAMGHIVLKFDPTCAEDSTVCFNPLMEIRSGQHEVRDTQLVADMIIDKGGQVDKKNSHWDNAANSLLVSAILHVLYVEADKSLAGVRNFLSNVACTEQETLCQMLNAIHDPDKKFNWHDPATQQLTITHPVVAFGAREMLNKSDPERTGIFSTALTALKLFRDPVIARNTRQHDFTIDNLVNHKKPVSLYLGIPPSDIERTMPLMRLVLQQILARLTEKLDADNGVAKRRQLLLMLDEFPQFGKLPFFEKALGYAAGYNIRAYLISQDIQQINKEYGKDHSILSNCGVRIAFTPNTLETAKQLSELIGITTIKNRRWSYGRPRFSPFMERVTINLDEIKRPLMTPDELLRMDPHTTLIFLNGLNPIEGHKLYYYRDPVFKEKSEIKPPKKSQRLKIVVSWTYVKSSPNIFSLRDDKPLMESVLADPADTKMGSVAKTKLPMPRNNLLSITSSAALRTIFLNWLSKRQLEKPFSINQRDSVLHHVNDGLLLVVKPIIEIFLQENNQFNLVDTDSFLSKLSKPKVLGNLHQYYWGEWENREIIEGFLVPLTPIITGEVPPINLYLQRDVT